MRIRSPSGWGLRKRAGEAAAPLFPPTANRRQAVLAREPRIRVDGQDANAAPTRFPVGTTAMNPSTAPAYPKAGLSKCRFQPQVFTRLFHVKHLFQPSLCCAKQTSPGKIRQGRRPGNVSPCIPPALRMAKKHRIRKDEAHRTRPVRLVGIQPLPRPAAMPKQARLRTRSPLRYFRIQPLFAIRSGGMRPRTAEGGREGGREGG